MPRTLKYIRECAFDGCTSLKSAILPDGMLRVGVSAFEGCTSLSEARFPAGLQAVEGRMFMGCTSLKSFEIPRAAAFIGKSAFEGCTSLSRIVLPADVCSVEEAAFKGCASVGSLTVLGDKPSMGTSAFDFSGGKGEVKLFMKNNSAGCAESIIRHTGAHMKLSTECCMSVKSQGDGRVEVSDHCKAVGSKVTLTMIPGEGGKLKRLLVNGADMGDVTELEITLNHDTSVIAEFEGKGISPSVLLIIAAVALCGIGTAAIILHRR